MNLHSCRSGCRCYAEQKMFFYDYLSNQLINKSILFVLDFVQNSWFGYLNDTTQGWASIREFVGFRFGIHHRYRQTQGYWSACSWRRLDSSGRGGWLKHWQYDQAHWTWPVEVCVRTDTVEDIFIVFECRIKSEMLLLDSFQNMYQLGCSDVLYKHPADGNIFRSILLCNNNLWVSKHWSLEEDAWSRTEGK